GKFTTKRRCPHVCACSSCLVQIFGLSLLSLAYRDKTPAWVVAKKLSTLEQTKRLADLHLRECNTRNNCTTMKLLCVMLCVALACSESSGTPVKRNSPTEMEMATSLEELGGNFEGDIVLSPEQQSAVEYGYTTLIGERYKWPDSIVPFQIDINAFTRVERDNIVSAMREIELVSCVRFVSRTTETDYIMVTGAKDTGCWSFLGHRGGMQTLNLQPDGCMARGTIIHELLHSLGFVHMQSASDRDF
uniref:Metalloendopeptidase n=1 Tax=Anopheles atroparvus TaxID=41427 RepID=A0A182J8W4_ANOAO